MVFRFLFLFFFFLWLIKKIWKDREYLMCIYGIFLQVERNGIAIASYTWSVQVAFDQTASNGTIDSHTYVHSTPKRNFGSNQELEEYHQVKKGLVRTPPTPTPLFLKKVRTELSITSFVHSR